MTSRKETSERALLIRLVGIAPDHDAVAGAPTQRWMAPATAVAAALAGSTALAAPGDLDPTFGDVGRVTTFNPPTLWSLDVSDDGTLLFGGPDDYCGYYYYCDDVADFGSVFGDGSPNTAFAPVPLDDTYIYDTAVQPDGKLVATGRKEVPGLPGRLVVLRLLANGSLDTGFGSGGAVVLPDSTGNTESGQAVLIEEGGTIVVAGHRGTSSVIARLQPDGTFDASFGTGGVVAYGSDLTVLPRGLALAKNGGYRLLAQIAVNPQVDSQPTCHVVGFTATGALDATFGNGGRAIAPGGASRVWCNDFVVQDDAGIVLGGDAYFARLLADGTPDLGFDSQAIAGAVSSVTALALGSTGKIFVAGSATAGTDGATVVRLLPNGTIDTSYGAGGTSRFPLNSDRALGVTVRDLVVTAGDAIVIGGYGGDYYASKQSFVARLLGDGSAGGPGVLGFGASPVLVTEQAGQATIKVGRSGGTTGAVSVAYAAKAKTDGGAVAGEDFNPVSGILSWADGEATEREIAVPVIADTLGENPEIFEVVLQNPTGGAGLGTYGVDVEIVGGAFDIATGLSVNEGDSTQIWVTRRPYSTGAVSVTLRISGGTAVSGSDFEAPATTVLSWEDKNFQPKSVTVSTKRDGKDERTETVTFELVNPTGGAQLGPSAQGTLDIRDTTAGGGGGGSFGGLGALLLGMLMRLRRRWGSAPGH